MKWWKGLILAVLVLGVLGITAASLRKRPPPAKEVQIAEVTRGTIVRTVAGAGRIQAATTVKISSNLSGDLTELHVRSGDRVKRGQLLARLERRRYEAAARQALAGQSAARADAQVFQVEAERARGEFERVLALAERGMSSRVEADRERSLRDAALARLASARERLVQAAAQYEQAQDSLSKTTLSSPIEGTVIEVSREVGERVRGSEFSEDVVMTIAALSAMEVRMVVGEHEVIHLRPGQKAEVGVDALDGQLFEGTVAEIAQKADVRFAGTEQEVSDFPVSVALAVRPPGVLPGMSAELRIAAETREDTVLVPIQAVTVRSERMLPDAKVEVEAGTSLSAPRRGETLARVVFVVDSEMKARIRRVKTGISSDTQLEILEGLEAGDRVIEGPYRSLAKDLKDGDPVREAAKGAGAPSRRG